MIAKKDFKEGNSGDTFNQLSLSTRSLRSLKPPERQECQTLGETSEDIKPFKEGRTQMESGFELRILNQHFLTEELTDACSHGQIFLRVCSTVISDADDGDWSINEAALSLMRSVKYGFPNKDIPSPRYYPEGMTENTLINCCGAYMLFCPSNLKWDVTIIGEEVRLDKFIKNEHLEYTGLQVTMPLKKYANIVYEFSNEAYKFFEGKDVNVSGWEHFNGQYLEFWNEFKELMKYIKEKFGF